MHHLSFLQVVCGFEALKLFKNMGGLCGRTECLSTQWLLKAQCEMQLNLQKHFAFSFFFLVLCQYVIAMQALNSDGLEHTFCSGAESLLISLLSNVAFRMHCVQSIVFKLFVQNTPESEKYACCPLPPYLEGSGCVIEEDDNAGRPLRDVCFHLLKLYSDRYVGKWFKTIQKNFVKAVTNGVPKLGV